MAIGYHPPKQVSSNFALAESGSKDLSSTVPTVDEVRAVGVAADIATTVNLPIAANVANLSRSMEIRSAISQSDTNAIAKPQIVDASTSRRTMITYTAKAGDTVQKIAAKYGISAQTVRWANDLTSDVVDKGKKLKILPTDGVLYTVEKGDTVNSIAKKYQATPERVRLYNDLDLVTALKPGSKIIIPSGVLPTTERPGYVAPVATQTDTYGGYVGDVKGYGGYSTGNIYSESAGNRTVYGECTWYAYERRLRMGMPLTPNVLWGNAGDWDTTARNLGYRVDKSPAAGAVMQNGGGWFGHVAVVESVSPGKSITISDMNYYAYGGGWNRITHRTISWSVAVSGYFNYIH